MRLILVRHGQSEGNAAGIAQGHLDYGLSELGRRQSEATARRLRGETVDRLVSSPLIRAADTAAVLGAHLGLDWEPEPALTEYDIGAITGLTGAEIRDYFPEIATAYRSGRRPVFPGEEGRTAFFERIRALLNALAATDKTLVAVAHGGVIGTLCYVVTGADYNRPGLFQVANCSVTEIATERSGSLVLRRQNDTCHLRDLPAIS